MPDREAIERGLRLEQIVADSLGGRRQPGSGSQWHARSDVGSCPVLVSCKSTSKRTRAQTIADLKEAIDCAFGTGDLPALAEEDPDTGQVTVTMRLEHFAELLTERATMEVVEKKSQQRERMSRTPVLLRE